MKKWENPAVTALPRQKFGWNQTGPGTGGGGGGKTGGDTPPPPAPPPPSDGEGSGDG